MKPAAALRVAALLIAGLPLLAACSGSGSASQAAVAPTPATTAPAATATPSPTPTPTGPDAACKAALTEQFNAGAAAAEAGQTPADPVQPPACKDVSKAKTKAWTDELAQAWIQQHLTTTNN